MSQGTPIIALQGPGQRDLIQHGINGFLVSSQGEMKDRIEQVASDPSLHISLQKNAFATAQHFTSKQSTLKLLGFYEKIIAGHRQFYNK